MDFLGESLRPLYVCIVYTVFVFGVAEVSRRILDLLLKNEETIMFKLKCNEFISTISMCACHFSEAVLFKNYGYIAMFIAIIIDMTVCRHLNRGAAENPMLLLEEALYKTMRETDFTSVVLTQYMGAACAMAYGVFMWRFAFYSTGTVIETAGCLYLYKLPPPLVALCEFFSCFFLRLILGLFAAPQRQKYIPVVFAVFFVAGQYIIGVPGAHPMFGASRFTSCAFVQPDSFTIYCVNYLFATYAGWMAASLLCTTPLRSMWRLKLERETAEKEEAERLAAAASRNRGRRNNRRNY
ncbi:hypothetical protein GCK72_004779 [Caenorhabditis remanei]|uniref:Aquaporin n=1 Tax=Caenorhabditis remanei TaxID=31234 RepID=A0A6A5HCT3_CAERE|nr:hypothetical protein GCK72_004779 [Caenorhabditis remanei]KAF1764829.1 hypothetical protein GCK72_004779 [Caenorhabditis remanei]